MKTQTKYFGEIEYGEDEVLHFPNGIFGFEEDKRFLLLPFKGNGTLFSLQSLQTPQLAFVLLDPFALNPSYAPVLQKEELEMLGVEKSEDLYFYTMCVVKDPVAESTVNLQCPVAVNGDTLQAAQVILEGSPYHMRHCLSEFEKEEDESC